MDFKSEVKDEEVEARIRKLLNKKDFSDVLSVFGERLHLTHRLRWNAQKDPAGNSWPTLSPNYAQSKRKKNSRGREKILVLTERLMNSFDYTVTRDTLEFGTNIMYGSTHQFGSSQVPARPFLGYTEEDMEYLGDELLRWLEDD